MVEPFVSIHALKTATARNFAAQILSTRGASKGRVKTSAPPYGEVYYVWRMVRFFASPDPRASCMPVCADVNVGPSYTPHARDCRNWSSCTCGATEANAAANSARHTRLKELDAIVNEILSVIPPHLQYGLRRWDRAMNGCDFGAASDPDGSMSLPMMAAVTDPLTEIEASAT
jgi:hypothetical protein